MQKHVENAMGLLRRAEGLLLGGRDEAAVAMASSIAETTGEPGGEDAPEARRDVGLLFLGLARLLRRAFRPEQAIRAFDRAASCFARVPEDMGALEHAASLRERGLAILDADRAEEAERSVRAALDVDVASGDVPSGCRSLLALAHVLAADGKHTQAAKSCDWALAQATALGDRELEAEVAAAYGDFLLAAGRADIAFMKHWRAFQICRQIGDDFGLADAARGLGQVALAGGRGAEALVSFGQVLSLAQQNDAPLLEAIALRHQASAWRAEKDFERAARDLGAALAIVDRPDADGLTAAARPLKGAAQAPDVLSAVLTDLAFTLVLSGGAQRADDLAHRALQIRARRRDRAAWKTCAVLAAIAAEMHEPTLVALWQGRARDAYPLPSFLRTGAVPPEDPRTSDALRAVAADAIAARRRIDPWFGDPFPPATPLAHKDELAAHIAALATPDAAAPIPSEHLPAPHARLLREVWRLGPWPEDDLRPDRDDERDG